MMHTLLQLWPQQNMIQSHNEMLLSDSQRICICYSAAGFKELPMSFRQLIIIFILRGEEGEGCWKLEEWGNDMQEKRPRAGGESGLLAACRHSIFLSRTDVFKSKFQETVLFLSAQSNIQPPVQLWRLKEKLISSKTRGDFIYIK